MVVGEFISRRLMGGWLFYFTIQFRKEGVDYEC